MDKVDPKIQQKIDEAVIAANEEREPSGRLSAGKLGWPLQWQMLNHFKVPQKEIDAYTLRKFKRGEDVEARIVEWVNPEKKQEWCEYRGVVGYLDMVFEGVPVEVKSVTNMAFKYLQKEGVPKESHRLQAELYAKALGAKEFQVAYVASDDYRVLSFACETTDAVDKIIDRYDEQVKKGEVPVFEETEKWTAMDKYSAYPEWRKLTQEQINEKIKEYAPHK